MLVYTAAAFHSRAKLEIGKVKLRHWLVSHGKQRTMTNGWRKQKLNGFVLVMLRGKQNGGYLLQQMHRAETMRMHGKRDMQALQKEEICKLLAQNSKRSMPTTMGPSIRIFWLC
jgi:hypothetical protein